MNFEGTLFNPVQGWLILSSYISITSNFLFAFYITSISAKTKQKTKKCNSPPLSLWKLKPTALGEGASAIREWRGKATHVSEDSLGLEPSYTSSQTLVKSQGGGLKWGCLRKCLGISAQARAEGRGLSILLWAGLLLLRGLTPKDHLDLLLQHPPSWTNTGGQFGKAPIW